jgi:hypothetical protein
MCLGNREGRESPMARGPSIPTDEKGFLSISARNGLAGEQMDRETAEGRYDTRLPGRGPI